MQFQSVFFFFLHSPDGHHSKRDVFGRHVVRALNFVDFVRLRHNHAVVLQDHRVGKHSGLREEKRRYFLFFWFLVFFFIMVNT